MSDETRVVHRRDRRLFELVVGADEVAGYAEYVPGEGVLAITHVVVDPEYAGKGYGTALAEAALSEARDHGLGVLPLCSFVRAHVQRNPRHVALVPMEQRSRFGLAA
jgi:predicted GNAT family acetyltransferase